MLTVLLLKIKIKIMPVNYASAVRSDAPVSRSRVNPPPDSIAGNRRQVRVSELLGYLGNLIAGGEGFLVMKVFRWALLETLTALLFETA